MNKLHFGTAGIPLSTTNRNTENGIKRVRELGLTAMELEFVHSVNLSEEKAAEVKEVAEAEKINLSCHAPYYINLNAVEKAKREASKYRIYNAAKILSLAGGTTVAFHPGFYLKQEPAKVHARVLTELKDVMKKLADDGISIEVRPETTGKPTQYGDLTECLKLSQEIENVLPCVDFAHMHARTNGKNNSFEEIKAILAQMETALGREILDNMHIQIAGINYTEKGERNHLALDESDLNYREILRAWKEFDIKGLVIAESPAMEADALKLQELYAAL